MRELCRIMKNENNNDQMSLPIFMSLGLSVGTAIGTAMNNISLGMCIGVSIGVGVGAVIDGRKRKKDYEGPDKDDKKQLK